MAMALTVIKTGILRSTKTSGIILGPIFTNANKKIIPIINPNKTEKSVNRWRNNVVDRLIFFKEAPKIQKLARSFLIFVKNIKRPEVIHKETSKLIEAKRKIIIVLSKFKAQTNELFSSSHVFNLN